MTAQLPIVPVRRISITGPDKDFTHESASFNVEDLTGQLTQVNTRARIRTRIETEYDPMDSTKRSVLFDGYIDRADGRQKGTQGAYGLSQAGSKRLFPSPAWKEFEATLSGMWRRLNQQLTYQRVTLGGGDLFVTNVCRDLLSFSGLPSSQIDIPDDPTLILPSGGGSEENLLEPFATIGDTVAGLLHDYLGWFLVWDGNAGANGTLRAIVPPPLAGPYNALARFTLDPPTTPGTVPVLPGAYGSVNWVASQLGGAGTDVTIPTCFIRKKTFQTHVKPPECNAIHVTATGLTLPTPGTGQYQYNQWAWNPASYDFFVDGSGDLVKTADPTNPDYLGEIIPLVVVNTSLGGGTPQQAQHSIDIYTRRLYDVAAHAQKWLMFEAPLALVIDQFDTKQSNPRPLRYYDPVFVQKGGVDTLFLVRSCNPSYTKDSIQMCHMEVSSAAIG